MTELDFPHLRLINQRLSGEPFDNPSEVVRGLVAVQSQDFAGAKWALAQRLQSTTDAEIDRLFNAGSILRTHVMRPTWHFVDPGDIRWLLALTAPRVHAANAYQYRQLELDQAVFTRTGALIEKALQGGRHLTRLELAAVLEQAGIDVSDRLRLTYIVMHAELEGLVCSGALRGRQHTYALLEERLPAGPVLDPEEALAELVRRYFQTRGPATLQDLAWWSGLTISQAARGLEMVKSYLDQATVAGRTFWFSPSSTSPVEALNRWDLLPNYDEYVSSYKDRREVIDPSYQAKMRRRDRLPLSHMIFKNGLLIGSWQRAFKKGVAVITAEYPMPLSMEDQQAYTAARQRFSQFLGMPVETD